MQIFLFLNHNFCDIDATESPVIIYIIKQAFQNQIDILRTIFYVFN